MSQEVKPDCEKHQHAAPSCRCSVEYDSVSVTFARIDTHRPYSQLWRLIIDSCNVMGQEYRDILECEWDKIPAQYQDLATDLVFVVNNVDVNYDLERFRCLRRFRTDIPRLPELTSNRTGSYQLSESFFRDFSGGHDTYLLDTLDRYYRLSQQKCLDDRMDVDDNSDDGTEVNSQESSQANSESSQANAESSQANAEWSQTNAEWSQTNAESSQKLAGPWPYYSLTVPFVQSSCTGKTRTAYEVVRKRFGLNICLREHVQEVTAYPPTDHQIRDYLTVLDSNLLDHVVIRYRLFLIELFRHTVYILNSIAFSQYRAKRKTLSEAWSSWFEEGQTDPRRHGENHRKFYSDVTDKAKLRLQEGLTSYQVETECQTASQNLINKLLQEYDAVKRHTYIGEDQNRVEFVIFFDEAHSLSQLTVEDPEYAKGTRRTGLLTMERAFQCLRDLPIFAVFMSTNSQLEGLATSSIHHPSYRAGSNRFQLFPPLSEFVGFDLFAGEVGQKLFESGVTLRKLCNPKLIVSFGRPHWYGVWVAFNEATPEKERLRNILNIALQKLNPDPRPERDMNARLAWIANRLCLEPDIRRAEGRAFQSKLIESYMGVVISIPEHRLYMHTITPSEPVLVEASARLMASHKVNMFKLLRENLGEGLLAKGERGEIVTRALMVLAHDRAARKEKKMNGLRFCRPIRLLAFLEALLTDSAYKTMMDATPVLPTGEEQKKFIDAFQDAWINISHFVRAGDFELVQIDHLRNFFLRGAAVQCHPTQEAIDCVAPILFAPDPTSLIPFKDRSDLKVQTKNRRVTTPVVVTTHQSQPELRLDDRPTVSIVIEYGDTKEINKSNCIEITHTNMVKTRSDVFRPQTINYQVTLRGLEAFRLSKERKTDIRSLLDLTSTLEFPRASQAHNVDMMRRLKPDYKASDDFEWVAKDWCK